MINKTFEEMTKDEQGEQMQRNRRFVETGECDHKFITDSVCENCFATIAYQVCDFEDKDRENPVIESFETLETARQFAQEWSADFGHCTIHATNGEKIESMG